MFKKVCVSGLLILLVNWSVVSDPEDRRWVDSRAVENAWIDSVFTQLTPDERIGQLLMVAAYSNQTEDYHRDIDELITRHAIGGIVFFQGGPVRQAQLTNRYQALSKVPLLIGMDAEWGLGMRLDSTISYPKQMTLGAIANPDYVYKMGAEIARQCRRIGVHVNFAPVVDINSDPNNPVIGTRSFGEDKENVAAKSVAYMLGMQHNGIMANAKHFPGHGDTHSDSHVTLPVIRHSKQRMSEVELYPFRKLIADSLMSVMAGHLYVPVYDAADNQATSLSKAVVTDLLKNELGFTGLVFTDALNMKAVSKFYKPGELEVRALMAGNDVLLMPENVSEAVRSIRRAIRSRQLKQADIDEKVRKILRAKYWAGLPDYTPVDLAGIADDLNSPQANLMKRQLHEQSMTIVRNLNDLLPIRVLDTTTFASVAVNSPAGNEFQAMLTNYAPFQHYALPKPLPEADYEKLIARLANYKVVIVGLHGMNNTATKAYGISQQARTLIERLRGKTQVIVTVFGNPYSLKYFDRVNYLLCAYDDNEMTRQIAPQVIFGALPATGKLPVSPATDIRLGAGFRTESLRRLTYSVPENAGMNSGSLQEIDRIVAEAIQDRSMPGCQIVVAKNGSVVWNRSYGFLSYDRLEPVEDHTMYDLASVTKVASTLQAVMFLHERGLIDVNKKVSVYLPELKKTNKEHIIVRDLLMHQAGLLPYIPYWERTKSKTGLDPVFYQTARSDDFPLEVVPGLYSTSALKDTLWKWTVQSRLLPKRRHAQYGYVYSDLGFIMLQRISEKLMNQPIEAFMNQNFYVPLGLRTLTFNPLCKFSESCIAPTEQDNVFRGRLIWGNVHDQSAAMMGGVAGHAGLFSNANDLAILMQMNLQNGYYGGRRYLQEPTLPLFTKSYSKKNRRGLGWDKPRPEGGGYVSDFASRNSYGHSGFTGTFAWVDPDEELVYIFLCNRVYPSSHNDKLSKNAVRKRIQDIIYKSIINFQPTDPGITSTGNAVD